MIEKSNEGKNSTGQLFHLNSRVEPSDTFQDIISRVKYCIKDTPNYLLCGLHACGDLSVSMLRQFVTGDAKAVVNVGCCYNQLTERDDETIAQVGFPVSQYLISKNAKLGFSKRMIATQATCRWALDAQVSLENFKKHAWRAMLQVLLLDLYPHLKATVVVLGKLNRNAYKQDFNHYCKAAFKKLKLDSPSEELIQDIEQKYTPRIKEVAVFWTLRGLLSETIEAIILLDRLLYLQEHGIHSYLVPLFPQLDSPRNMAIVGIK
jgi:hypothetical protein